MLKTLLDFLVPDGSRHLLNAQAGIALAALALYLHATWIDVVIHPFFFTAGGIVTLLVPGIAFIVHAIIRASHRKPGSLAGGAGIVGLLLVPILLAAFSWPVLAKTPAWLAAIAFGTPHTEVREFEIRRHGLKGCASRAEVTDGLRLYPGYLCVSPAFASQHDRQRVRLRLVGDRTPLGFRITHFEHEAVAESSPSGGFSR